MEVDFLKPFNSYIVSDESGRLSAGVFEDGGGERVREHGRVCAPG